MLNPEHRSVRSALQHSIIARTTRSLQRPYQSSVLHWESLEMIRRSPGADVFPMSESIARATPRDMRNIRDRRPHAHAAWTEHFP
jgi:hypothetical protein